MCYSIYRSILLSYMYVLFYMFFLTIESKSIFDVSSSKLHIHMVSYYGVIIEKINKFLIFAIQNAFA